MLRMSIWLAGGLLALVGAVLVIAPRLPGVGVISYTEDISGGRIYVMDVGRSIGVRVIDNANYGGFVNWTPDAERLTWARVTGYGKRIDVYDIGERTHTEVDPHGLQSYSYVWTPDGTCLLYAGLNLYRYCVGDEDAEVLMRMEVRSIAPMHDTQTVYMTMQVGSDNDIYRLDIASGDLTRITTDGVQKSRPSVALDGSAVYYSAFKRDQSFLFRYDLAAGSLEQLTSGGGEFNPAVSADGRYLVYTTYQPQTTWDIFLLDLQTRQSRQVTFARGTQSNAVWMPE